MNDRTAWHNANDAYLSAALLWLRLRLQRLAEVHRVPTRTGGARPASRGFWSRARDETAPRSLSLRPACRTPPARSSRPQPRCERRPRRSRRQRCVILSRRLGLGTFEEQILLLCAAMELDTRIGSLCAQAQGDVASVSDLRAGPGALRRSRVGSAVAGASASSLAADRDQPACSAAADGQRVARRRARGQLSEGPQLRRRSADASF